MPSRSQAVGLYLLAWLLPWMLDAIDAAAAQSGSIAMICTNAASGASWNIEIDYDHATVDANPARISAAEISWHDARDGANYTLDRKSGRLRVVVASSTGGYVLYHRCRPATAG